MNLPNELPEGSAVYIVYPVKRLFGHKMEISRKIRHMHHLKLVLDSWGDDIRLYITEAKIKYTKIQPWEAWNEGMTLKEFEEYLDDSE